ncbi:MAG: hypothetical protein AABW59_03205 [archaeon]
MDEKAKALILVALIAIVSFIGTYFFSASGMTLEKFLTPNFIPLLGSILTLNFVAFLFCSAIVIALILFLGRKFNFYYALGLSATGLMAGSCIGVFVFNLFDFFLAVLFANVGIFWALLVLEPKEKELKYAQIIRSGSFAAEKIILFASIGLFFGVMIATVSNQAFYEKKFTDDLLAMTIGNEKTMKDAIQEPLITGIADAQKQTIDALRLAPQFTVLKSKNDADVLIFVATIDALSGQFGSESYKDTLRDQISKSPATSSFSETLLKSIPLMATSAKAAWIIYAIQAIIMALFIGGIIVKNGAGIVYNLFALVFPTSFSSGSASEKTKA